MTYSKLTTREKDSLVAVKVMGWKLSLNGSTWMKGRAGIVGVTKFSPSTSIADAMMVVDKMRSDGWLVDMISVQTHPPIGRWSVMIYSQEDDHEGNSNSLSDAISLCSLRAVRILKLETTESEVWRGK